MKFHPSIVQTSYQSPLGRMTLAATAAGLAGVWFIDQRHLPSELTSAHSWPVDTRHPLLVTTATQLTEYFAGQRQVFDLPLDLSGGTAFQQAVWQALLAIQPGQTSSYGNVSKTMGNAAAVRAVGAAVGRNPISIIVPCHRVLGSDGSLTGYAGGLDRKTALLRLEGALEKNLI
jgi:methylated-DNA-[protein]-cysteine S-methyltransferase